MPLIKSPNRLLACIRLSCDADTGPEPRKTAVALGLQVDITNL